MTTPYGVTAHGIAQQLINDGHCKDLPGPQFQNAQYLKGVILRALSSTVVAAKELMAYFQGVAEVLAEDNRPLVWRTPIGFKVTQAYYNHAESTVRTLVGRLTLWEETEELGLKKSRQVLASAPNVVHSMDACHLAMTALMAKDNDLNALCFIHDSFGTHAGNTDKLAVILRETFCELYENLDWVGEFERQVREMYPDVELPERPKLGTLDVSVVRQSPYFFA